VRPEGLGQFKNPPHRDLNPRPSGLQHSALTTTLPHVNEIKIACKLFLLECESNNMMIARTTVISISVVWITMVHSRFSVLTY
jgi:hypothetical protein